MIEQEGYRRLEKAIIELKDQNFFFIQFYMENHQLLV